MIFLTVGDRAPLYRGYFSMILAIKNGGPYSTISRTFSLEFSLTI
jgi:hypothetical protein